MKASGSKKLCPRCKKRRALTSFGLDKSTVDGLRLYCKECSNELRLEQYDSKKRVASTKRWQKNNREKYRKQIRERRRKLKRIVVDAYGGACVCCGEKEITFLTIEHLNGDGKDHREKLGGTLNMYRDIARRRFPSAYTILCMNCNWAKRFSKTCPHQITKIREQESKG